MRLLALLLSVVLTSSPGFAKDKKPILYGTVSSTEEGKMEGVLVSARRLDSNITVTVVTNEQGYFQFPDGKLGAGSYSLSIRAVGYDLIPLHAKSVQKVGVPAVKGVTLQLGKTRDLPSQMSNGEWMASVPGTDQQKGLLLNCVGCHTLERVVKSPYDADTFMKVVLPRMQGWVNQSIPQMPQRRVAERRMEERGDQRVQVYRSTAEYLATINVGEGQRWGYELKRLPRPKGRATKVIYTEYDLPRDVIQPHDVVVDDKGIAWYSSFGEQNLGRLDPRTGAVKEYKVETTKPGFPTGFLGLRQDRDGNLWMGNMYQAQIVKFDRATEKLTTWLLPPEQNIDAAQINMVSPQSSHVDGKVWTQNNGFAGVHRLDLATGRIETWEPFKDAPKGEPHNIYDVIPDSQNNAFFTDFRLRHIGRIDAKTGETKLFEIPGAPNGVRAPRRAQMDAQDRLWFAEYRGDRIGMLDTKSGEFKEWQVPTRWMSPYDVALDKNGDAWTGSMITDQVVRLDTKTGAMTEYLLPRHTNIRRVHVDNSTTPVTFWIGSNHGASIVKMEPLD
jgi:virginiamycin B lyase